VFGDEIRQERERVIRMQLPLDIPFHYTLILMMVNTRIDADLSATVQNALQTLLPQIRAEIREEFRTSSGQSDSSGNPPSVMHLLGGKPISKPKGGDVWLITVTWAEFKKLFFLQFFPRAEQERLKRENHSIRQMDIETSTEFMQRFL
nr:zinc finger, CCHC-type, retrotransposon Gag domain protein [Tanacetum cinerariifolium]